MPAERSTRRTAGKRAPRRNGSAAPEPMSGTTQQPTPERRFVDVDPWAMLLEGLMTTPEEEPAERKGRKGK
jgi:hypothetical protein